MKSVRAARRYGLTLAFVLVATVLNAGVGQTQSVPSLRVAIGTFPVSADPNRDTTILAQAVYTLVYETLTTIDHHTGRPVPSLAQSWQRRSPTEWWFTLRPRVLFHNGEPVNATAVKYSIDRILNPGEKSVRAGRIALIRQVDVVDDLTVRILTKAPAPLLPSQMVYVPILPPRYITTAGEDRFAQQPVGTGPYRVVDWTTGSLVRLQAFPGYWGRRPPVSQIEIRDVPEPSTRIASLEAGEIDVAYDVFPEQMRGLKSQGYDVRVAEIGGTTTFGIRSCVTGPTRDARVRQAMNYAVDKKTIISRILLGAGALPKGQVLAEDAFGYNTGLTDYPYDPAKARQLLVDAGYPNGFSVKMAGTSGRALKDKEISEAVATYLQAVGVNAQLEIQEGATWSRRVTSGTQDPIFFVVLFYTPVMDWDTFPFIFLSNDVRGIACDSRFDQLYHQQAEELNPVKRLAVIREAERIFRDDALAIFVSRQNEIYALGRHVVNLSILPDYSMDLGNIRFR